MIPNVMTATPHTLILVAEGLDKFYGPRQALKSLSFSLEAGRILGLLGPNGAGKTTAIRILTTVLDPSAGHFTIDGISSEYPDAIRRRIGALPESLGFQKTLTALEFLVYFGQLYGLTIAEAKQTARALLTEVGLNRRANSLIGSYSRGMRQRLGIARALVNDPVVLFLDEPTLGLDPRGQQELLDLVKRIARQRSVGIIMCSHALSEVEGVCDDVVILSEGQVVAKGTVADVTDQARRTAGLGRNLRIRVALPSVAAARHVLTSLPHIGRMRTADVTTGWLHVELANPSIHNKVLEALIQAQIPILGFEAEGGRLQDVFLHLTKEHSI